MNKISVFSDDSNCNKYHSLSLITIKKDSEQSVIDEISQILKKNKISTEFKWSKVDKNKHFQAAKEFINFIFSNKKFSSIRCIVWGDSDYREDYPGKDDQENLARYYYHLLYSSLKKFSSSEISLYPDTQDNINWELIKGYLNKKRRKTLIKDLFKPNSQEYLNITQIQQVNSETTLIVQLADLLAGIVATSYGDFSNYSCFNLSLFDSENISLKTKRKWELIHLFDNKCKEQKLNISLKSTKGFFSNNDRHFLHIWRYMSQGAYDKAPKKQYNAK